MGGGGKLGTKAIITKTVSTRLLKKNLVEAFSKHLEIMLITMTKIFQKAVDRYISGKNGTYYKFSQKLLFASSISISDRR